ncbi:HD domain-containing protein [Anabaena sp. UHCC 0253]|nr:HD domain-containing protein [Anabaena sp. UHCC 0204]MTJ55350.1 HD domain-containing protein [Anabaena sp. UHCC 0253]
MVHVVKSLGGNFVLQQQLKSLDSTNNQENLIREIATPLFSDIEYNTTNIYDSIVYKTSSVLKNHPNLEGTDQLLFFFAVAIGSRDPDTGDHCERLVKMGSEFGKYLQLSPVEIRDITWGAYLHDIGKIATPDTVLLKKEKLTPDEWEIMKQHVVIGERICQPLASTKGVLPIIRNHHERWDGSGYPDGLKGNEIPYIVQVFQIIDIYDALISTRPYKKGLTSELAISLMWKETNTGWRNPELMEKFTEFILQSDNFRTKY